MENMLNISRTETEHWLLAQRDGYSVIGQMDQAAAGKELAASLWPFLNPYFSPLNAIYTPIFKWFLSNQSDRMPKEIMARDGAVALAWFFHEHSPKDFKSRLLVHEDLESLVPTQWRSRVSLYGWRSSGLEAAKAPEAIILTGPMSERVIELAQIDETIDEMAQALGESRLSTIPVKLYTPLRGDGEVFHAKYLQKIFGRLKKIEIIDWRTLESTSSFKNCAYVELNGGWLYQDSFVQRIVLSRGAHLLLAPPKRKNIRFVPLSTFHGVEITNLKDSKFVPKDPAGKYESFFRQAARLTGQAEGHDALWPNWFEKLCHAKLHAGHHRKD